MKASLIALSALCFTLVSCSQEKEEDREKKLVQTLHQLDSHKAAELNFSQFNEQLASVSAQVDAQLQKIADPAFHARVRVVQSRFVAARDTWKRDVDRGDSDATGANVLRAQAAQKLVSLEHYVEADKDQRTALDEEDRRAEEAERLAHEQQEGAARHQADEQRRKELLAQAAAQERMKAQAAAAETERKRRYAPDGTLFLITPVTVHLRAGLASLLPGTEVTVIYKNPNNTLHVKESTGTLETDIEPSMATNDRDLAAKLRDANGGLLP